MATDLDRTLIYSRPAMNISLAPGEITCVERYDGHEQSYVTNRALSALMELQSLCWLVPVTTRTPEQYARVRLNDTVPRFAICSNGGDLLIDGQPDPTWRSRVRSSISECAGLPEVSAYMQELAQPFLRNGDIRFRTASDLFAYVVLDSPAAFSFDVARLTSWAEERGWKVSHQGRKVYCAPAPLTKARALAEVVDRTGAERTAVAGDSWLDVDLLEAADAAIRPGHGELHDRQWSCSGLEVTSSSGIAAGEEIVEWFLKQVRSPSWP